ncbi:MAG: class I SAM-dependent methyltransferase [Anaerolineae bacterium]
MPDIHDITAANRAAWNEVMPYHQRAAKARWDAAFSQPGYSCLREPLLGVLAEIGLAGKTVAQLCCNNGVELMSLKNLGAGECVGFDISDEAIAEAQQRARRSGIACSFVQSDIYALPEVYDGRFDLALFTAGALGWLPDLPRAMQVAAGLLSPGGRLLMWEIHPVSEMLPFDDDPKPNPLRIVGPYFKHEPYVEYGDLDYVGGVRYASDKPQYWYVHTLAETITAVINAGLVLERFNEYPDDISAGHKRVEQAGAGVPLSFILQARKV